MTQDERLAEALNASEAVPRPVDPRIAEFSELVDEIEELQVRPHELEAIDKLALSAVALADQLPKGQFANQLRSWGKVALELVERVTLASASKR